MRMLRFVVPVAAILLLSAAIGSAYAQSTPACSESLLVKIPWGDREDGLSRGDTTVAVTPAPLFEVKDGSIYLLDRVAGRMLVYDDHGVRLQAVKLPAFGDLTFPQLNDFRLSHGRILVLGANPLGVPSAFLYDLGGAVEPLPLRLEGEVAPDPAQPALESYKLTVGEGDDVYLFHRMRQWSVKIFDGAPVPEEKQIPEEGLVVGRERLRFEAPRGDIKTVGGRLVSSGALRASGGTRVLVQGKSEGQESLLLVDTTRGVVAATLPKPRQRVAVSNSGTRYRFENGYYELYFDAKAVFVTHWISPRG